MSGFRLGTKTVGVTVMESQVSARVSVIVAVYNGEMHIRDCLNSILNQTYQDFEIIVVNDGSADRTQDLVCQIESGKLSTIRLDKNYGVSAARNKGMQKACGELIAIMDADDIAMPNRLAEQVDFLDKHRDIDLVGSYVKLESEAGSTEVAVRPLNHSAITKAASWSCPLWNTTLMFRSHILQQVPNYPEEFRHGEDYRFLVQVMKRFKVANIPQVLVIKHENRKGLTFRISPWHHFRLGLSHRLYAVQLLNAGPLAYVKAVSAAFSILIVRLFGLNREVLKSYLNGREGT